MPLNAALKLFPPPTTSTAVSPRGKSSTNHSRKLSTRRHAIQPQSPPQSASERAQLPTFPAVVTQQEYAPSRRFSPLPITGNDRTEVQYQYSQTIRAVKTTSPTPTSNLMRNTSNVSHPHSQAQFRSQISQTQTNRSPNSEVPVIRSIFPTYNPDLRLEHQDYYPNVQLGDERGREIPRAVLSKQPHSPSISDQSVPTLPSLRSQLQRNPSLGGTAMGNTLQSPPGSSRHTYRNNSSSTPLPQGPTPFQAATIGNGGGNRSPTIEEVSSTEELRGLWRVTNGWRASPSEGRTFVLQMISNAEGPGIHTLSSRTSPFYTLRIEPTSTSAHLSMHRHDPSKASSSSPATSKLKSSLLLDLKSSSSSPSTITSHSTLGSSSMMPSTKVKCSGDDHGIIEVLTTTLEESHRRLPPNDGLIAILYPTAATALVIQHQAFHPHTPTTHIRSLAEQECARLIWDQDSQHYYLNHPCLSQPFIIRITKSPAWSKVEYLLEHSELPVDLVRLVRSGGGRGWVVVDSGTAGRLEGKFVVDVGIMALFVVALQEEEMGRRAQGGAVERFEGPPTTPDVTPKNQNQPMSRNSPGFLSTNKANAKHSKSDRRFSFFGLKRGDEDDVGVEERRQGSTELQLESQEGFSKKAGKNERLPCALRCLLWAFKVIVWIVGAVFGCLIACVVGVSECLDRRGRKE